MGSTLRDNDLVMWWIFFFEYFFLPPLAYIDWLKKLENVRFEKMKDVQLKNYINVRLRYLVPVCIGMRGFGECRPPHSLYHTTTHIAKKKYKVCTYQRYYAKV